MKKSVILACLTLLALTSCGLNPETNLNPSNGGDDSKSTPAPSIVGDWRLISKTCKGIPRLPLDSEEIGIGNRGGAIAFRWTEETESTYCNRLDGYLFQLTSASSESLVSARGIKRWIQQGFIKPYVTKNRCWHVVNGKDSGAPYLDTSKDLKGSFVDATITQYSNSDLSIDTKSSPFCNGEPSILKFERI